MIVGEVHLHRPHGLHGDSWHHELQRGLLQPDVCLAQGDLGGAALDGVHYVLDGVLQTDGQHQHHRHHHHPGDVWTGRVSRRM